MRFLPLFSKTHKRLRRVDNFMVFHFGHFRHDLVLEVPCLAIDLLHNPSGLSGIGEASMHVIF